MIVHVDLYKTFCVRTDECKSGVKEDLENVLCALLAEKACERSITSAACCSLPKESEHPTVMKCFLVKQGLRVLK